MSSINTVNADLLNVLRPHILNSADYVVEAGWEDLAEAVADVDVAAAAIRLGEPAGEARASVLLAEDGSLHDLSQMAGWEAVFLATIRGGESAIAA